MPEPKKKPKKKRVWQIQTAEGPFRFFADNKHLAADHAERSLCGAANQGKFPKILDSHPVMVGWAKEEDELMKV